MANTYYDSELTGEEIEQALEAIDGVIVPANNGKVLAVDNGKIVAKSVQRGGGSGGVSSVNSILPDWTGNVTVTADDIQTDDNVSVQDDLDSVKNTLNSVSSNVSGLTTALRNIKSYYGETSGSATDVVFQTGTFTFGFLIGYYRSSDQSANRSGYAIVFVYNNTAYITQKTGLSHVTSASYNNGVLTVSASTGYTNYNLISLG